MSDPIMIARQEAAYRAWLDLVGEFSETQRMWMAKHMSHGYKVKRLTLTGPDGDDLLFIVKPCEAPRVETDAGHSG